MSKNNVYIETYGCQMNTADTEVVMGILNQNGYGVATQPEDADVILLNTCSIRENAERKIYTRLGAIKKYRKGKPSLVVGILGCMAERLRSNLVEKNYVDVVVGPDEYRRLPELIDTVYAGSKGIGVKLSRTETYDDIVPFREDGLQAWISVMRGCDKFCTYCVVPYTRGRERSRSMESIVEEVKTLSARGFREITLLGQNVNSYLDNGNDFADLLAGVAAVDRSIRFRFSTSHPQDLSEKLIQVIADNKNICNYIHLPVQSGSDRVLELMNRTYTADGYMKLIEKAKELIPDVSFSTDIIAGFPTETLEDHLMTLDIMEKVKYDGAYMFKYSPREGTKAFKMVDDIDEETKSKRLADIITVQQRHSLERNTAMIGKTEVVLIEGFSKKSKNFLNGRTDSNKVVIFAVDDKLGVGDYVEVKINRVTSATLFGDLVSIVEKHPNNIKKVVE